MIIDHSCIQQIFGALMKHPQYFSETDKYNLSLSDFQTNFERYIFGAIYGLYGGGAKKISPFDVGNYLESNKVAKKVFEENRGAEYLADIEEFSNEENFSYYYNKLKKINLLNSYKKIGVNIDEFYIEDLLNENALEVNKQFEELTINDIVNGIKKKILKIENQFLINEEIQTWTVEDEIDNVIDNFGAIDEIGTPIQGEIYSQVINGAEKGALTIRSAASGSYKTRSAVADACHLAYPFHYDSQKNEWVNHGNYEKILFIMTEQKPEQILRMVIAYLTDINESKFKIGKFSQDESLRINQARAIIKRFSSNFIMMRIPDPTIEVLKNVVREKCLINNISVLFYDYIFISSGMLNEFKGAGLRNDELLFLMSTALKDLAIELNISVFTSTQVNAKADENRNIRSEATLAGSRAIINKADNGCIMARPTKEELEIVGNFNTIIPNLVTDVYKVRSGAWSQVRIWSYFNGGTMKREDLYITDAMLNPLNNFFEEGKISNWETQINPYLSTLEVLNRKEVPIDDRL